MQVFVPHVTFQESVRVLDDKRLGKQRVETYQILMSILKIGPGRREVRRTKADKPVYEWDGTFFEREPKGWSSHPAVLAWRDYPGALAEYQHATCAEWVHRGYADTCLAKTYAAIEHVGGLPNADYPDWWGIESIHASHRGALLHKDPEWYSQWGWTDAPAYAYVWPHELQETA